MDDYILVVEDETIIAMDIEMTLVDQGHGPVVVVDTVTRALSRIDAGAPRAAVLDLNLGRRATSVPVAQRLNDLGVPFLFLSGYNAPSDVILPGLGHIPKLSKPFNDRQLGTAVGHLLARGGRAPA